MPRPQRRRTSACLFAVAAVLLAIGSWQPSTMAYIHAEILQNVLAVNLDLGVDRPYSDAFIERLRRDLQPQTPICTDQATPLHPNVLFVLFESLSMRDSQLFGGARNLMPNLDRIAREQAYLPNFIANGFSTDGGLIALLTGRAPIPAIGAYESMAAFKGYDDPTDTLPEILHANGYDVDFFTTGDLNFLDKKQWFTALKFDHFEGAENPFYNGWKRRHFDAAEDKALYQRFLQWLDARGDGKPWFSMLLTVSTHPPFINPETEQLDEEGAFRYADRQLGMLYDELQKRKFFDNGILLIAGDHRSMTPRLPAEVQRFGDSALARVPMVIVGNGLKGAIDTPFSQTDLLPSLRAMLSARDCRLPQQGNFFGQPPVAPTYIEHARGDKRDRVDVFYVDDHGGLRQAGIVLDGDASHWIGEPPPDAEQILLRVAADRIARGPLPQDRLDFFIKIRVPQPSDPSAGKPQ